MQNKNIQITRLKQVSKLRHKAANIYDPRLHDINKLMILLDHCQHLLKYLQLKYRKLNPCNQGTLPKEIKIHPLQVVSILPLKGFVLLKIYIFKSNVKLARAEIVNNHTLLPTVTC